jgi:GNAT superfamily N-acetyltransferase
MIDEDFQIRLLREEDLACVDEFVQHAGWNQLRVDWLRVLQCEPNGCFAAFAQERWVGTVTTTRYGNGLGWIGMMLVHADFRRRGIATALMRRAMAYLDDKVVRCIKLDATPEGQFVYEQLGFVTEWKFHRWERSTHLPPQSVPCNLFGWGDERLAQFDRIAFGADRSKLLIRLAQNSFTVCDELGFGMIRSGRRASYLGPVTAATPESAERMIRMLVSSAPGRMFWDIPGGNSVAQKLAEQLGFVPVRVLTRMKRGEMLTEPKIAMQYAIAAPETG